MNEIINDILYFNPYKDDFDCVHSIDKCSITFVLKNQCESELKEIIKVFDEISNICGLDGEKKLCLQPRSSLGWSKHIYHFRFGLVAFLGFYQFCDKDKSFRTVYNVRLEFNPNKQIITDAYFYTIDALTRSKLCNIGEKPLFLIIRYLNGVSSEVSIKRIDYAIDVPVSPDNVIVPASRKKQQVYNGTRYFGVGGAHGRLKIYDKACELGRFDDKITRVEYTFKHSRELNFDNVYILKDGDNMDDKKLSSNDKVIAKLCATLKAADIDYMQVLKGLDSRKRKRVIEAVEGSGRLIVKDNTLVDYLVFCLSDYLGIECGGSDILIRPDGEIQFYVDNNSCEQYSFM